MNTARVLKVPINQKIKKQIFSCLEADRDRIAEILLNDIAQLLFAAKLKVSTPPDQKLNEYLSLALTKVRDLAYELKPPAVSDFGFLSSIDELVNNKLPGKYKMQSKPALICVDNLMQVAIYRVMQIVINFVDIHSIQGFMYFILKKDCDIILKIVVRSKNLNDPLESGLKQTIIQSIKPILSLFRGTYSIRFSSGCTTIQFILKHQ